MSHAFVREMDDDPGHDAPPELKTSSRPNRVTARGLQLIEEKLAELDRRIAANPDDAELAWLRRDQRYWSARRATAQVVEAPEAPTEVVFGSRVTFRRNGGPPESVELVGEDEADPAAGRLSWVAPIASAMLGAEPGEVVELEGRRPPIRLEILAVEPIRRPN